MSRLNPLPKVMLAPNGARRTKADHPALPMTTEEIVTDALAAHEAGAQALHAHVRDDAGAHSLDPGRYRELLSEMARKVPNMAVQITTEAAERYGSMDQMSVVRQVLPEGAAMAPREMWRDPELDGDVRNFYAWCDDAEIAVQHILYDRADIELLGRLATAGAVPAPKQCIFVLGSYEPPTPGRSEQLAGLLAHCHEIIGPLDWAVCAFGRHELACLLEAAGRGGAVRAGFENNLEAPDGSIFANNAQSIRTLVQTAGNLLASSV